MKPFLRNLFFLPLVSALHGQSISMNFGANEGTGMIATASSVPAGAVPVPGSVWNNLSGATQADGQPLIDSTGATTGATVTWASANTWRSGSPGGTATSQNGILTKGYLDDGGGGNSVTVSNVPYISYDVYVIRGSDQGELATYRPVTINGTTFRGNEPQGTLSTATIVGNAATTGNNWTNGDVLLDGRHYHFAPNRAGLTLSVRGNTGTGRGPIAGIQIVNTFAGTLRYWDINGSAPGAGGAAPSGTWDATTANWNDAAGTGTPSAWSGVNSVANFAAGTDATGSYTVTVDGTRSADGIVLHRGNLTLTGGTLDLTNARLLRSINPSSTLRINSAITGDGGISAEGSGPVIIGGQASHTGPTVVSGTSFTLATTGSLSATSALEIASNSTAILSGNAAVAGNISLSGATVYLSESAAITAGGNILLNNLGTSQFLSLNDNASLIATSPTAGEFLLNRGEVTLNNNSSLTVRAFFNRTNGLTTTLNVGGSSTVTVNGFMVLGDNTNAAMVVNQTGGTVNSLGNVNNPGGNSMSNRWGHWGNATTTYNLSAGQLNIPNSPLYLSWDSGASLNISGTGTASLRGVNMGFGGRANASTINLNAGGTLNIGQAGMISGGGANKAVNLNGGTLGATAEWTGDVPMNLLATSTIDTTGGSISLNGGIAGEGGLVVQGGNTLALGGFNTFTGPTTVNSGTLRVQGSGFPSLITVNSGGTLGGGSLSVPGSAFLEDVILTNGSRSNFRISEVASDLIDILGLTVNGTHTLTVIPTGVLEPGSTFTLMAYQSLSGTGGFNGITVESGTPRLAITKLPNTGSALNIRVDSFDSLIWKGTHPTTPNLWDGTAQNFLTSTTNQATAFLPGDVVRFDDTASTGNVTLAGTIAPFAVEFANSTIAYNLSGSPISGSTGLLKTGTGTVQLGNANTYTGVTRIEGGILRIGDGTGGSIAAGAPVEIIGGQLQINMADGAVYSSPTLVEEGALLSFVGSGGLTITGPTTGGGNLLFDREGVVLLNAANAAAGTVTVNSGTLAVDGSQVGNRMPGNKLITVNSGATFEIRGVNAMPNWANSPDLNLIGGTLNVVSGTSPAAPQSHAHLRDITLNGATINLNYSGVGTAYNDESFQLNGTLTVTGSAPSTIQYGPGADATNSGIAIQGNRIFDIADVTGDAAPDLIVNAELENHDGGGGVLTKTGPGTLALNGMNTYSGGNEILAGTVSVTTLADGAASSIGTGYLALKNGSTLEYRGTAEEVTSRLLWLDSGAAIFNITQPTASLTFQPDGGAVNQPILKRGPGSLTLDLGLAGAATITVQEGTLSLPQTNFHEGNTTVSGGTLIVAGSSLPDTARLTVSGAGRVQVNANETVNTLVLGGIQQNAGTYGATGSGATNIDNTRFSGTGFITVVAGPSGDSFASWIDSFFPGITDPNIVGPNADPDGDGIPNAVEMVIGNSPNVSNRANLPTAELVTNPAGLAAGNYLKFSFRRTQLSVDANVASAAQYGSSLTGWTTAQNGTAGVTVIETPDASIPGTLVDVYIPQSLAPSGRLFGRLLVTVP